MLEEATKKLKFADFLISRHENPNYMNTAIRHITEAANIAIAEFLQLDSKMKISPALASQKLSEGSAFEKDFAANYMGLLRMVSRAVTKEEAVKIYKQVNTFVNWVREQRLERYDSQSKVQG